MHGELTGGSRNGSDFVRGLPITSRGASDNCVLDVYLLVSGRGASHGPVLVGDVAKPVSGHSNTSANANKQRGGIFSRPTIKRNSRPIKHLSHHESSQIRVSREHERV